MTPKQVRKLLKLTKRQMDDNIPELQKYFKQNFEMDLSSLQAQIFIEFIAENLGPYYYNIGVEESMRFLREKTDDLYSIIIDIVE